MRDDENSLLFVSILQYFLNNVVSELIARYVVECRFEIILLISSCPYNSLDNLFALRVVSFLQYFFYHMTSKRVFTQTH